MTSSYIAIGTAVFILLLYTGFLRAENNELREEVTRYEQALRESVDIANDNAKALENQINFNKKLMEDLEVEHAEELSRAIEFAVKKENINNVKEIDDGVTAPVLVDTFEWLRKQTSSYNGSEGGQTGDTK